GLGATLYHILTGQPPYEKQAYAQLIAKVRRGEFKNPRDVNAEVPSALQGICLKAMSFKPADRYLSARELADDVERWLANEPLVAGIFHQLRQRLAVQFERTVLPSPADAAIEAGESRADLLLLSLVPTRRVRFVTDARTHPADYELASLKAESLLARIYQARQVALDREVVVKVFKPRELDEETRRRYAPDELERVQATLLQRDRECFLSEAVVTANLEHPGIIPVHDIFRDDGGSLYIAMKWIRGMTWNNVLVDRTEAENVDTLLRAAYVVAYAHSRGILHRDIKPANVFLGAFGETCVVDWGAALVTPDFRSWGTLSAFPTSGWGTPLYAAPEQILGTVDEIDVRSDVYLLGATLFEVLAGFPPHPVPADATEVRGVLQRNEIRPTDYRGPLLDIALRAMASSPADRYATVREFQAAIRESRS
ncbi:MAG: protein kinase, partial [Planctomycetia bacterium]|nr:protein kinase [Planctomycetia bacterium]